MCSLIPRAVRGEILGMRLRVGCESEQHVEQVK